MFISNSNDILYQQYPGAVSYNIETLAKANLMQIADVKIFAFWFLLEWRISFNGALPQLYH